MYWFVGVIIWGLLWGAVCRSLMMNKGYDEGTCTAWFILGLLIGIFAFIIVITKPDNPEKEEKPLTPNTVFSTPHQNESEIVEWTCSSCGTVNRVNKNRCFNCGVAREKKTLPSQEAKDNSYISSEEAIVSGNLASQLTELKSLYEQGFLTEEEFNAKKKQILGI